MPEIDAQQCLETETVPRTQATSGPQRRKIAGNTGPLHQVDLLLQVIPAITAQAPSR